ncbi:Eco57I restriction-modification methylase domain-containing protein [Tenacibaculum piscium]|uniref:Eco57I restriction-modification methylase domain-containing protein n=1 Tax=Tenacibaculum piscium TaxID=1458515 RepID=UPI0023BA1DF8|nr:TaqI-like C-terminal specificity domain-containing protein [Tenacibaculum piscium]
MSLFQKSVLKKHLKLQEKEIVEKAYKKYTKYFLNPTIQENIRSSKEEEYQGIFLTELFVTILDYTLKPNADFNLVAEYKNQTNARKADGAILNDNIAIAVIELKGTKTKDLESIRKQAFDYKANQKGCVYVITSNFEKLRFYINDATEFEEFNLFELTKEQFQFLYLCLHKDNIINNIPLKIKEASVVKEEQITKEFYNDYSLFKRELYRDLIKQNLKNPVFRTEQEKENIDSINKNIKLSLFKKSQKLIDRFLFIFFAEDRGLLPPNSTLQILENWDKLKDLDVEVPLYNRFKLYFKYLDTGREGTDKKAEIFAYNGGLFKPDAVLDSLILDDTLLYKHTKKLSEYDFDSQVDVNILGHIFENSLNEIESVNAEIQGSNFDKQTSKRKKDGVFYTPKYITKYIVDNTVGKLCTEKKIELGIKEDDYFKGRKNRNKTTIIKLVSFLDVYRDWLLKLTICDPACGSGAFLNQALDFLIKEHTYIDELKTKLLGGGFIFPDIENTILENNIFGVDLNEESVEIAKLSLWLRTAQPRRKLNNLNSNIKCGNSLIDSKTVAGDKAFNWENEFPQIFENGGFDVIIGNPPYVLCQPSNTNEKTLSFYKKFEVASYKIDLFHLFFEKSISILKNKGALGFITPNTYLNNKYIKPLRDFILKNTIIEEVINHEESVFSEASVDVATILLTKGKLKNNLIKTLSTDKLGNFNIITEKKQSDWENNNEKLFNTKVEFPIKFKDCISLDKICNSYFGIQAYDRKSSISEIKVNENFKEIIDGGDIFRNKYSIPKKYFNFISTNIKSGGDIFVYQKNRIVIRQIGKTPIIGLCNPNILTSNTLYNIYIKDEDYDLFYILGILNSKILKKYWLFNYSDGKQLFPKIKGYQLKSLPIKVANSKEQKNIINSVSSNILINTSLDKTSNNFQNYLKQKFQLEKLSKKLQNWYDLEFGDFIKELNKAIKINNKELVKNELPIIPVLTKLDEMDWMDVFTVKKSEAQALQTQINQTDTEIDAMVYKLYNLTDAEIAIVENS